jgi:hypothetical protein
MKRLPPLLCLVLLAGCTTVAAERAERPAAPVAQAPAPPPPPPPPPSAREDRVGGMVGGIAVTGSRARADCPLSIAFASYGAGIDNPVREQVQSILVGDHAVTGLQADRWGREGEVTLCVRTRAAPDAARLFHQVRAIIPAQPRGPIALRTLSGLSYDTPPPRR